MKKQDTLAAWRKMPEDMPILKEMNPIPYKAEGSKYGACGIRIDGTPKFVDAVLSHLKDVLDGENTVTRLELSRMKVDGSKLGKAFHNQADNAEVCYIRLHVRGGEGSRMLAFFGTPEEKQASFNYAEKLGL